MCELGFLRPEPRNQDKISVSLVFKIFLCHNNMDIDGCILINIYV